MTVSGGDSWKETVFFFLRASRSFSLSFLKASYFSRVAGFIGGRGFLISVITEDADVEVEVEVEAAVWESDIATADDAVASIAEKETAASAAVFSVGDDAEADGAELGFDDPVFAAAALVSAVSGTKSAGERACKWDIFMKMSVKNIPRL